MPALCPNCGKEVKGGFCQDCFLKLHPVRLKELSLKICNCGKFFYKGEWGTDLERSLVRVVRENLILPREIKLWRTSILGMRIGKKEIFLEIEVRGEYHGEKIMQRINSRIKIEKIQCDECGRRPEYYEAIIQFRGFEPKVRIEEKWVSGVKKIHHGLDFYLADKGYARQVAKEFGKKGFRVKESEKLMGIMKSGKRKSRLTISIKPKNDFSRL